MAGFEDLLPAEISGKGRSGSMPMRPAPPPPPAAQTQQAALSPPCAQPSTSPRPGDAEVDGIPDSVVDAWFQVADADGDGRVADSEARDFFLTSGLAAADLSKIWKLVKSPDVIAREGKGLTRHRFAQVLRLIALAQSEQHEFSQENASAALHSGTWLQLHGTPLPPPRIAHPRAQQLAAASSSPGSAASPPVAAGDHGAASQAAGLPAEQQMEARGAATASPLSSEAADLFAADAFGGGPSAAFAGPQPYPDDDDDDLFGLRALQERAASHGAVPSVEPAAAPPVAGEEAGLREGTPPSMVRRMSRSLAVSRRRLHRAYTGDVEPPVAFEARLPPLQPRVSAKLTMLAAVNGSLFAGPAVGGGLLQWGRPEGNMRRPLDVDGQQGQQGKLRLMSELMTTPAEQQVETEDADAAPSIEVPTCGRGRAVACLLVDEPAQLLWVADKDGWVHAYSVAGEPCMSLRVGHRAFQWQAHRVGYATAMCRTPQGHLWTGSSRGSLRVWELGEPALVGEAPEPPRPRELRKGFGERAHGGPVLALVVPAEGQLVWSASQKGVLLWDAACGAFLGSLQRPGPRPAPSMAALELSPAPSTDLAAMRYKVDGQRGLEVDPITGYVVDRPPAADWARIALEQEAWAMQSDNNINELMERVSMGGSKVVQGAGKAVKLLGKLARGLGGGGEARGEAPKQGAARLPSSASLAPAPSPAGALVATDEDGLPAHAAAVGDVVALVAPPSGGVWVCHKSGVVDRYSGAGQRRGTDDCGPSITAAACVGDRVWLGFADGMLSIRDRGGAALRVFQAHSAGILSLVQAGSRTFSLAADGSLKGWSAAVPSGADDETLASWDEQACMTYRRESLRVLAVTWNVGESKPEAGSPFFRWVHDAAANMQLAVVALQEIEMGSSSVALAAAKDAFSHRMQERGNTNAKFWVGGVLRALGGERHWHQVGLRQLSGMLVMVFARNQLRSCIGEVTTASVACGVLGVGGNKGAVAVEFSVHRRKVAVVCSHFAAHQGAVEARNANYANICRQLTFSRRAWYAEEDAPPALAPPGVASTKARERGGPYGGAAVADDGDADSDADSFSFVADPAGGASPGGTPTAATAAAAEVVQGEGMREADMLLWLGDFNYRIEGGYEAVKEKAVRAELDALLDLDQCRREMAAGRVFRGLREGPIGFRPTYKYDRGSANPFAYDSSDKKRVPAWCDRVFFRGSRPFPSPEAQEGEAWAPLDEQEEVLVRALQYGSWDDVIDSDHKPVFAVLEANLPITDQAKKREVCSQLLKECRGGCGGDAATAEASAASLAPEHLKLHPSAVPRQMVLLRNEGQQPLLFSVSQEADGAAAAAFAARRSGGEEEAAAAVAAHQLLEVRPVRGVVPPGSEQQLWVHLSGDEWALQGAQQEAQASYAVRLGSRFSAGGQSTAADTTQLSFTATCLTHL